MTFDDWWEDNKEKAIAYFRVKDIARLAYIAGQADTLETIDPDKFDPLLFVTQAPAGNNDSQTPGLTPEFWEGATNGLPLFCASWIIIFGIIVLAWVVLT